MRKLRGSNDTRSSILNPQRIAVFLNGGNTKVTNVKLASFTNSQYHHQKSSYTLRPHRDAKPNAVNLNVTSRGSMTVSVVRVAKDLE